MGEVLSGFGKTISDIVDATTSTQGVEYAVLPLDGGSNNLHYSAILLVGLFDMAGQKVASVFTMILEGSNSQPRPIVQQMHGRQVEVILTAMDAWDEKTSERVQATIVNQLGDAVNIMNAGAATISAEFDYKNIDGVYKIVHAANEAIFSTLESQFPEEFDHFNIGEFYNAQTDRMVAQFTYNGHDAENVVGLPIRSDISLTLSSSDRNQSSQDTFNSFQHNTSKDILEVDSFVDMVYSPQQEQPMPGQMPITQMFVPRVVITKVSGLDAPFTPEVFLLGIATAGLIKQDFAWASVFSNFGKEEIHDIGAVGYRMKNPNDPKAPSEPIDTKSNTFGEDQLFDMIQTTCHKDPVFSIDCEDVGPESWLTGALVEAAHGNQESAQYIIDAANNLTNGLFSKYWQGGAIVASENNRVHLGTYQDEKGDVRDLREIDSLAILNLFGHNDMTAVNEWESTYNDMAAPIELRLEKRLQLQRAATNNNLKIRGFAERLTFTPDFLAALVNSVVEAGLMVDQDGLKAMYGQNYQVGNAFVGQYAAVSGNFGGMMQQRGPQGGAANFRRPMGRQWS
jgi:hypothetical protein